MKLIQDLDRVRADLQNIRLKMQYSGRDAAKKRDILDIIAAFKLLSTAEKALQDLAVLDCLPPIQCEATAEELIKAGYM
jgi:hypothetical protein